MPHPTGFIEPTADRLSLVVDGVLSPAGGAARALDGLTEAGPVEERLENHGDGEHADEQDQPVLVASDISFGPQMAF